MAAWIIFSKVMAVRPCLCTSFTDLLTIGDTVLHAWEVLAKILQSPVAMGIICDIGMYATSESACSLPILLTRDFQARRTQECHL